MSFRVKGLLICPFILFIITACVSTPENPSQKPIEKPVEETDEPEENPISFYRGPEDAAEAIRVLEEVEDEKMDRDSRFIYYSLLISNNDLDRAAEQLEILMRDNPDDREVLHAYITMADYRGEEEKRDSALDHLLAIDPSSSFAFTMKGTFALREKEYNKAIDYFLSSLSHGEERIDPEACLGLANAYMHKEGEEEKSLRYFEMAEELDSENPYIYSDRSRVYRFLKDYGKAEDDMTRAIELYPNEWNYLDRARIRIGNLNDFSGAKEDLLAVLDYNRDNFFANVYLAGIFDEEGDYDKSLFHYERVVELASDYNFAYPALGKLYYIKERWADSAEMYRKAVETGLNDMTYPLMGWLALIKEGKESEGQRFLNANIGKLDRSSSIYEMYRYYLSPSSPYFVQMGIEKEKDKFLRDRMKFYMGMIDALEGRADTARAILGEIADRKGAPEFELAKLYMEKE